MTSDQEILNKAKEQVAKENNRDNWASLLEGMTDLQVNYYLEQVAKVAIQLQREQMEKEHDKELIEVADEINKSYRDQFKDKEKQITDLKAELSLLKEEKEVSEKEYLRLISIKDTAKNILEDENDLLQGKLDACKSSLSNREAKAFDEGVEASKKYWLDQYRFNSAFNPTNPYTQDQK